MSALASQSTLSDLKLPEVERLEKTVRDGMKSFMEVGKAILELRDRNGWKARGFKTPEEYFQKTFGFGERQALRLADGFQIAEKVKAVTGELPRNEFAARVIKPVASDPKLLGKVQDQLKKKGLSIASATADKIQEVVERVIPKTREMFDEPKPKPSPVIAGLSAECPNCHQVPNAYRRNGETWHCDDCKATVQIGALALEIAVCADCGAPLLDESGICNKCGSVQ